VADAVLQLGVPLCLLVLGYVAGSMAEQSHYKSIRVRELRLRRMPTTNLRRPPAHWRVENVTLVAGSADLGGLLKRFLAQLRGFIGGRVPLRVAARPRTPRGRAGMKEEAVQGGFDAVINVRLESTNIAAPLRWRPGHRGRRGARLRHGALARQGAPRVRLPAGAAATAQRDRRPWTATLFAPPGMLVAGYELPITMNTIGGFALFSHGAAAGAGAAAGLAFALRGFWNGARAEWIGFVLCLLLTGGALATHVNAEQPEASRRLVASHVVDDWNGRGRRTEEFLRRGWLRSVAVAWQGRALRVVVDRDLILREGSAVVLSVYDGRFGFPVIERVQRAN
jgi:uncharacterized protein YbjQ (UPF0145 family)